MNWNRNIERFTQNNICPNIKIYYFEAGNNNPIYPIENIKKPNILMIAATHGDEPSGYHALNNIKNAIINGNIQLSKGSITLIPALNEYGLNNNKRETDNFGLDDGGGGDINRSYPKQKNSEPKSYHAQIVQEYMKYCDLILDFHEGYHFYKMDPSSIGSTLHATNFNNEKNHAFNAIKAINNSITDSDRKWTLLDEKADIPTSCRYYAKIVKKPHILIETTGKLNAQPLQIRVNQATTVAKSILNDMGMLGN